MQGDKLVSLSVTKSPTISVFISCGGHQLYDFKEHGVDLEVEGMRHNYRDASRAAYVLGPPPSRGGDLALEGGVNVSL